MTAARINRRARSSNDAGSRTPRHRRVDLRAFSTAQRVNARVLDYVSRSFTLNPIDKRR